MQYKWPSLYQLMQVNKAVHYNENSYLPEGYQVFYSSEQLGLSKKGYHALAVINHQNKQLVICNAGTKIEFNKLSFQKIKDMYYDTASNVQIMNHELPYQYKYAFHFTKNIIEQVPNDYNITITGYSLGAILADLTAYTIAYEALPLIHVVTFENPGSLDIIETKLEQKVNIKAKFSSYNAAPNLINIFGRQVDKTYLICLDQSKYTVKTGNEYLESLIEGHFFQNFMDAAFYLNGEIRYCGIYDEL